jgi:hypothetical protein
MSADVIADEYNIKHKQSEYGVMKTGVDDAEAKSLISITRRAYPELISVPIVDVIRDFNGWIIIPEQFVKKDPETKRTQLQVTYLVSLNLKWVERQKAGEPMKRVHLDDKAMQKVVN